MFCVDLCFTHASLLLSKTQLFEHLKLQLEDPKYMARMTLFTLKIDSRKTLTCVRSRPWKHPKPFIGFTNDTDRKLVPISSIQLSKSAFVEDASTGTYLIIKIADVQTQYQTKYRLKCPKFDTKVVNVV